MWNNKVLKVIIPIIIGVIGVGFGIGFLREKEIKDVMKDKIKELTDVKDLYMNALEGEEISMPEDDDIGEER